MTIRFASKTALPLLFSLTAFTYAQTNTPPPMKMGLWQSEVTVTMSGMPNGVTMPAHTMVRQSCMTPDTWKDSLRGMQSRRPMSDANCTTSNMAQDSQHVAFDAQCTAQQGMVANIHVDMQFDSSDSMHGSTSASMTGPSVPPGMAVNSTIKSKFVSADCGDVKPGQQKDTAPTGAPPS
jgi:hypothetical protein